MNLKTKPAVDKALAVVREFLEALIAGGKRLGWYDEEVLMTAQNGTVLTFTTAERARFYRCLVTLGRAAHSRPIAEATLRQSLEDALFRCLSDSSDDISDRVTEALDIVRRALLAPERAWRVAFRIQWLEGKELPFQYRGVSFVAATREPVLLALESNLPETQMDDAVFQFLPEATDGLAVAVVDVKACDVTSARALGLEIVHSAVDELTGLTTLVSDPSSHVLTDVMNALPIALVTLTIDTSSDEVAVNLPIPLPWDGVRPRTLFTLLERSASAARLRAIVGPGTDDVTERIRSAARYIGRAVQCSFQHRTADAFLYYVIALEALLGKPNFRDSIGYQQDACRASHRP